MAAELGAGDGELAIKICSCSVIGDTLQHYWATDVGAQVTRIQQRIEQHGLSLRVEARQLWWGEAVAADSEGSGVDVVLCADLLYWNGGDILSEDTLEPLLTSAMSACGPHTTLLFSYRERHPEREANFVSLCCARGLLVEEYHEVAQKYAPVKEEDPDQTGGLRMLKMTRAC